MLGSVFNRDLIHIGKWVQASVAPVGFYLNFNFNHIVNKFAITLLMHGYHQ